MLSWEHSSNFLIESFKISFTRAFQKRRENKRKTQSKLRFNTGSNEVNFIGEEESKTPVNGDSSGGSSESVNQKYTYYYYHKMLSSDQYNLGKKVSDFIEYFGKQYSNPEKWISTLPKPLNEAFQLTNTVVNDLHSTHNISGNNKNLTQFCRSSVEKYLFSKIYTQILPIYKCKYLADDKLFSQRSMMTKATDPIEMLRHLGVNKKFIICEGFRFSNSVDKYEFEIKKAQIDESISSSQIVESEGSEFSTPRHNTKFTDGYSLPYRESIKSLEKISEVTSPRDKLDWIIEFFSNMKASIVDYWKGKIELATMDDILPLTIYWVCYWNWDSFATEMNFINDFIKIAGDDSTESIERTVFNILMGIEYVNTTEEFPFGDE
jgi:hypothetical protein